MIFPRIVTSPPIPVAARPATVTPAVVRLRSRGLVPLLALVMGPGVFLSAQVAAPTGSTAQAEALAGETVELSPFLVSADKDVGYVATNTLAGSRMNTELRDTAATIGVLTSEFLADVGATSLTEALEWGNNVQLSMSDEGAVGAAPNDNGFFNTAPQFRVRGILATVTRNYFEWSLPIDTYNVERVEEARGPNSILFGIGSAGGVINSSTKVPVRSCGTVGLGWRNEVIRGRATGDERGIDARVEGGEAALVFHGEAE